MNTERSLFSEGSQLLERRFAEGILAISRSRKALGMNNRVLAVAGRKFMLNNRVLAVARWTFKLNNRVLAVAGRTFMLNN